MSLSDDNIFEKMRIILPEHKRTTMQTERELKAIKHKKPVISEDQYAEFSSVISDAITNQSKVKVTLWNQYGNKYIVGIPVIDHGLRIQAEDGIEPVDTKLVIDVSDFLE